jgi:small GTP-binding protein
MHVNNKIVIIGDSGVGKSTIITRLIHDQFIPHSQPTIGAAFCTKKHIIDNRVFRFNIWDTAGQERYRALAGMYYKDTVGCICVFDVGNRESFFNVEYWIDQYQNKNDQYHRVIILVANKSDIILWEVSKEEIEELARKIDIPLMYTNCIDGQNIQSMFDLLGKLIVDAKKHDTNQINGPIVNLNTVQGGDKSFCCN